MIDIKEIFKNKKLEMGKLQRYGFVSGKDACIKDYPILNNEYIARIFVTPEGSVDFRVYETESGEEYLPAHIYNASGAFIGEIHNECEKILTALAHECFITERFKWEQSKRILRYIKKTYNAEPEFLWRILPECAALRVPGSKPWLAVIGKVPKDKFGLNEGGYAEVLNLKDEPKEVKARINAGLAYPGYHMNKQHRYSLFLDGRRNDKEIILLIEKSCRLVNQ